MKVSWIDVETEFRAGSKSLRAIAALHGTSEGSIRRHAKRGGWIRDAGKKKREKIKAHFAGDVKPDSSAKRVQEAIDTAVSDDIKDMECGLKNARLALDIASSVLNDIKEDPKALKGIRNNAKNLKLLSETNKLNIDVIRKIRGLDEQPLTDVEPLTEDDEAILERFTNAGGS